MDTLVRFKSKFVQNKENGCWDWIGTKASNGYGRFDIGCDKKTAHRVSWELFKGNIPSGKLVLHKCGNRGCVNPDHLHLGDHSDNMSDMLKDGTYMRNQPLLRKLYDEEAWLIRRLSDNRVSQRSIAKMFKISPAMACNVINNYNFPTKGSVNKGEL